MRKIILIFAALTFVTNVFGAISIQTTNSISIENQPALSTVSKNVDVEKKSSFFKKDLNTKSEINSVKETNGKSRGLALILCIFLGFLGFHRFYLGYLGWGVIYLLTLGFFGIGWIIDIFRLLGGSLKPRDGSYE